MDGGEKMSDTTLELTWAEYDTEVALFEDQINDLQQVAQDSIVASRDAMEDANIALTEFNEWLKAVKIVEAVEAADGDGENPDQIVEDLAMEVGDDVISILAAEAAI